MSVVENRDESAPSWLKELEAKREKRVKARLGHEAGAGAPCLTWLDLHFWRKICKMCKCSKENHDVNDDDDLYGWAQFQLFGNKPNRLIKRIQLPNLENGTNEEYELDWVPTNGQLDTIDNYLKQLPKDLLPIKGSLAAQLRKQMLQKQLPIHDIDPTLCHELSELEMKKMYDYIEHMKANSVGIGQIIQIGKSQPLLPPPQQQQQQQHRKLNELPRQFEKLTTTDESIQQPTTIGKIRNIHPTVFETKTSKKFEENSNLPPQLPQYVPDKFDITTNQQQPINITNIKDLAYSTYENPDIINSNYQQSQQQKSLKSLKPLDQYQRFVDNQQPNPVRIGLIRDINYDFSGGDETSVPLATPSSIGKTNDNNEREIQNFPLSNKTCKRCQLQLDCNEFAIYVDRNQSYYHTNCFKCNGCNQNLVDMFYFYDLDNDDVYCGRDFAKIRGIPRCEACDELIFVQEYCLTENATYHIKHFCCFECDQPLAGKNYLIDDSNNNNQQQPLCLNCYELLKANKCETCKQVIKPDEQGCNLNGVHFHAENQCFCCCICKLPLFGAKLLLRNKKLYCSHQCYQQQQ